MVTVELVYIPFEKEAVQLHLSFPSPVTVAEVIAEANLNALYPETTDLLVGIFGKQVPRDRLVQSGDRVELYRGLTADPKEKRRLRALQSKQRK